MRSTATRRPIGCIRLPTSERQATSDFAVAAEPPESLPPFLGVPCSIKESFALTGMPQHYATATIARLVEAANKVRETRDRTTLLRVVNG